MTRLLIDCTRTVQAGLHTGIQRVVRQTLRHAAASAALGDGPPVLPVMLEQGRFVAVPRLEPHPFEDARPLLTAARGPVDIRAGDVLLLPDAAWYVEGFAAAVRTARNAGARIAPMVHDLISIQHPHWFDAGVATRFAAYLDKVLPLADAVVSVSHATDRALLSYLRTHDDAALRALAGTLVRHVNHPGADGADASDVLPVSPDVRAAFERAPDAAADACLIQVGSIEPRKHHEFVLDACELAWDAGAAFRLILVGSHGWRTAAFSERVARHPRLGQRLFHLQRVTDADLAYAYRRADASIHASAIEGYGLPIAEAGYHRVPVLLADTAIHREVGGPRATYFSLGDRAALATLLAELRAPVPSGRKPSPDMRPDVPPYARDWASAARHRSWGQSTRALIGLLMQRAAFPTAA